MATPARYYSSTAVTTTLASSIGAADTSLQVASSSGFPSSYPFTLILEKDAANEEIVTVTALVGSAYTITRGVDGTSARAHAAGTAVEHGVSALDFTDFRSHQAAAADVHDIGATSSVVGTETAQTLTNKTLTSPTINTPTVSGGTITGATITNPTFTSPFTSPTINTPTVSGGTITGATITDPTFTGDLKAPAAAGVEFEGTTDDGFETRLIAAGPTADRTVTLPDADDTLVGKATSDTLTNKTVSGGTLSGTTTNTGTVSGGTVSGATVTNGSLGSDLDAAGYRVTGVGSPSADTDAATKGYVDAEVAAVVDAAPGALDTLNELAAALGDDANFSTTVTNSIATKVAKAGDTLTGDLTMSGGATVKGLPDPSVSSDAVNLGYVTTLYGSTSSAATSATAAAASASAASASQTAASGSASAAAASASAASSSASSASASASNAATSESNAATSATAAAASKTATDAAYAAAQLNFGDGRAPVFLMMGG